MRQRATPGGRHRRRPALQERRALALVVAAGVVFAVLQLAVTGTGRELRWDEVVYLSQVSPWQPAVDFGPHRARGMSVLVAPLALLDPAVSTLRWYMIALSSLGLVLAFRSWVRALGYAAGVAALAFATSWTALYFGVEVYPNLAVAFCAVAATGYIACWDLARDRASLTGAAAAVALLAFLRPPDSVWLCGALGVLALAWWRRNALRPIVALALGGIAGWLPWIAEAFVRFGGPLQRLDAAQAEAVSSAQRNNLIQYLNLVEGPVRAVVADPTLTVRSLILLVTLSALVALGLSQRDRPLARGAFAGLVGCLGLLLPYLLLTGGINLRYVLPAQALLMIPVGAGLVAAWRRGVGAGGLRIALVAVALLYAGWQAVLAYGQGAAIAPLQARAVELAEALDAVAAGRDCAFVSETQFPEIQWNSDCIGDRLWVDHPSLQCPDASRDMSRLAEEDRTIFVVGRGQPGGSGSPLDDWEVTDLGGAAGGGWRIWERPPQLGPGEPPAPASPDAIDGMCPASRTPDTDGARLRLVWDPPA
jgi:hypothetical protein